MNKVLLIFISFFYFNAYSQDATTILKKSEEKIRGIKSSYTEMAITIVRPKWKKEMTMKGWSVGEDYFSSVVITPVKEKGTVFLKRVNEVWNYVPSIERTIKLPPSMMMQNWMGTDFTNDDLVQRSSISDDYTNTIIGNEGTGMIDQKEIFVTNDPKTFNDLQQRLNKKAPSEKFIEKNPWLIGILKIRPF
jgi:outer membrane lipoprotein-sorting protein